ncbi:MAG: alpha/beta fold hydrolase [Actinobacteria bacterium]|nr:MAG: alpha/beta fold hydrolase [Actinomycetota bacterium]
MLDVDAVGATRARGGVPPLQVLLEQLDRLAPLGESPLLALDCLRSAGHHHAYFAVQIPLPAYAEGREERRGREAKPAPATRPARGAGQRCTLTDCARFSRVTAIAPTHRRGRNPSAAEPSRPGPASLSAWTDVDWRSHQRWVSVDGQPVNTIELGEGPPVVFVHGLSGSWQNWLAQLPALSREHRVVALDLPGFGYSPMPREEISIAGYARMLDGLLDQLEIAAAAVVGNSMGGFIGAELAIAFPQRVERLVLVSAAGLSTASRGEDNRRQRGVGGLEVRAGRPAPSAARGHHEPRCAPSRPPAGRARGGAGSRRRKARVHTGAAGADRLRRARSAARGRLPHADRMGRARPPDHGPRRRRLRGVDPGLAQGHLRGHRPRGDARAPRGVQRAAREVPRRAAAQRVIAPSAALPTSLAYFWMATSTCSSARRAGT